MLAHPRHRVVDAAPLLYSGARMATWRSGDAADCKSAYPSSILGVASKPNVANVNAGCAEAAEKQALTTPAWACPPRQQALSPDRSAAAVKLCNGRRLLL
jgi:hypothetical protein